MATPFPVSSSVLLESLLVGKSSSLRMASKMTSSRSNTSLCMASRMSISESRMKKSRNEYSVNSINTVMKGIVKTENNQYSEFSPNQSVTLLKPVDSSGIGVTPSKLSQFDRR